MALLGGCCDSEAPVESDEQHSGVPLKVAGSSLFDEVAGTVGLDFSHFVGATGEYYFPEMAAAGVAVLDYDGDGDLDVYLLQGELLDKSKEFDQALFPPPAAHWPGNRLFRNEIVPEGALRFSDVTDKAGVGFRGYGMGVAVGDMDNDGDPDLYVTNYGRNVMYRNNGNATFTDITAESGTDDPRWNASAAFCDYDRDGDLDLFVTAYVSFNVKHNKTCSGLGGRRDFCGPTSYEPLMDRLFRNDGDGRFTDVTVAAGISQAFGSGLGVTCADFNGDGETDIYVANDQRANQLWINRGDGIFKEMALISGTAYNAAGVAEASMGVTAGDFDGDGDEDLFMTHLDAQTNTLYLNDGKGTFFDVTDQFRLGAVSMAFTGFGSEWFDYDNNGTLDLFVANGAVMMLASRIGESAYPYEQTNQLFRNDGDQGFSDISHQAGLVMQLREVSRGAAFGDIDNDGDVDIVVSNNNGPARLMINKMGNRNHWLRVRLVGTQSNRDGIGARVAILRPGKAPVWRRAHTDGSYLSANDIRVHFGLGTETALDGVAIRWPSGRNEVWRTARADTQVVLKEGTGESWDPDSAAAGGP